MADAPGCGTMRLELQHTAVFTYLSPLPGDLPVMMTCAPLDVKAFAVDRPRPEVPPVIITLRPA